MEIDISKEPRPWGHNAEPMRGRIEREGQVVEFVERMPHEEASWSDGLIAQWKLLLNGNLIGTVSYDRTANEHPPPAEVTQWSATYDANLGIEYKIIHGARTMTKLAEMVIKHPPKRKG